MTACGQDPDLHKHAVVEDFRVFGLPSPVELQEAVRDAGHGQQHKAAGRGAGLPGPLGALLGGEGYHQLQAPAGVDLFGPRRWAGQPTTGPAVGGVIASASERQAVTAVVACISTAFCVKAVPLPVAGRGCCVQRGLMRPDLHR